MKTIIWTVTFGILCSLSLSGCNKSTEDHDQASAQRSAAWALARDADATTQRSVSNLVQTGRNGMRKLMHIRDPDERRQAQQAWLAALQGAARAYVSEKDYADLVELVRTETENTVTEGGAQ